MNKKRNFAKTALLGVLLCGLAGPTFVGCKDYDDDIKDLQEQIDVNKAKVDADAMNKAIQAEITKLQNELTQAINGKASASEISAIQGKLDQAVALSGRVSTLEEKISTLEGKTSLSEQDVKDIIGEYGFLTEVKFEGNDFTNAVSALISSELIQLGKDVNNVFGKAVADIEDLQEQLRTITEGDNSIANLILKVDAMKNQITALSLPMLTEKTVIKINRSQPLGKDIKFNGKEYKKGAILENGKGEFAVLINPSAISQTALNETTFSLEDAAGNTLPFVVNVVPGWTPTSGKNPFTRAAERKNNLFGVTIEASKAIENTSNVALKAQQGESAVYTTYDYDIAFNDALGIKSITMKNATVYMGGEPYEAVPVCKDEAEEILPNDVIYDSFITTSSEYAHLITIDGNKISATETVTDVPSALNNKTVTFKYNAKDKNGNIFESEFKLTFIYGIDITVDGKTLVLGDKTLDITKPTNNTVKFEVAEEFAKLSEIKRNILNENANEFTIEAMLAGKPALVGNIKFYDENDEELLQAEVTAENLSYIQVDVPATIKAGKYDLTLSFKDKRNEAAFEMLGSLTINDLEFDLKRTGGYWNAQNQLTVPGVFTAGEGENENTFVLKGSLTDAFNVTNNSKYTGEVKLKFDLVDADKYAGILELTETAGKTQIEWLEDVDVIGEVIKFNVTVQTETGEALTQPEEHQLVFVNPMGSLKQNTVEVASIQNDKNSTEATTFNLSKLLSLSDTEGYEMFKVTEKDGKITEYLGSFNDKTAKTYGLTDVTSADQIKFEIVGEGHPNFKLNKNMATWTNLTGVQMISDITVNVKVTVTHKYGVTNSIVVPFTIKK